MNFEKTNPCIDHNGDFIMKLVLKLNNIPLYSDNYLKSWCSRNFCSNFQSTEIKTNSLKAIVT